MVCRKRSGSNRNGNEIHSVIKRVSDILRKARAILIPRLSRSTSVCPYSYFTKGLHSMLKSLNRTIIRHYALSRGNRSGYAMFTVVHPLHLAYTPVQNQSDLAGYVTPPVPEHQQDSITRQFLGGFLRGERGMIQTEHLYVDWQLLISVCQAYKSVYPSLCRKMRFTAFFSKLNPLTAPALYQKVTFYLQTS